MANVNYQSFIESFQRRESQAREANLAREREIRGIYGDIIRQYETGGAFKVAGLADIERTKTRAVGAGMQQMISSGLYGTTTAASIPVQAEAGAGYARLKLEDILQQRTTGAKLGLAGFAERIETPYPDYNMLIQAMIAQASTPRQTTGSSTGRVSTAARGRLGQRYSYGRGTVSSGSALPTYYNPLQDPTRHVPIKR